VSTTILEAEILSTQPQDDDQASGYETTLHRLRVTAGILTICLAASLGLTAGLLLAPLLWSTAGVVGAPAPSSTPTTHTSGLRPAVSTDDFTTLAPDLAGKRNDELREDLDMQHLLQGNRTRAHG